MTSASIEGTRFLSPRYPAWQALGTRVPDTGGPESLSETLARAGLDFQYLTIPLHYTTPSGDIHRAGFNTVVRAPYTGHDDWHELGIVGPNYTYLQNRDLLRGVRHLQQESGWKLDTLGTIGNGSQVFMALAAEERSIFGDRLKTYVIIHDAKAQRRSLNIAVTPVRLICMNQLRGGQYDLIRITHRPELPAEYAFWVRLLGKLQKQQTEVYEQLTAMASHGITDEQARSIIERAYPMPKVSARMQNLLHVQSTPGLDNDAKQEIRKHINEASGPQEKARELATTRRRNAYILYQRLNAGDEQGSKTSGEVMSPATLEALRETPYLLLQAITELVDWSGQAASTVAAGSSLFGQGARTKIRAWKLCLAASK